MRRETNPALLALDKRLSKLTTAAIRIAMHRHFLDVERIVADAEREDVFVRYDLLNVEFKKLMDESQKQTGIEWMATNKKINAVMKKQQVLMDAMAEKTK